MSASNDPNDPRNLDKRLKQDNVERERNEASSLGVVIGIIIILIVLVGAYMYYYRAPETVVQPAPVTQVQPAPATSVVAPPPGTSTGVTTTPSPANATGTAR